MIWLLGLGFFLPSILFAAPYPTPIPVTIEFIEALSPKDTTSSVRFQHEYETAISTAKTLVAKRLASCGYKLESHADFFDASDSLQALEKAKTAESKSAWLLAGPRRSNQYVLMTKGAPGIPSVSTMASSDEVAQLGPLHLSVVANNKQMAEVGALQAKKHTNKKEPVYVSVVSRDCVTCVDFAAHFDKAATSLIMKKLREIQVAGEAPATAEVEMAIKELKPDFVLVPNFSKTSALIMAAIHKIDPKPFFVGGDGWGDSKFGFVEDAKDIESVRGITVRGFPTPDKALKKLRLGLNFKNSALEAPSSGPTVALLKIVEGTADLLCKNRPTSREEFIRSFEKSGKTYFKPTWGVSVYALKGGNISFEKTVEVRK